MKNFIFIILVLIINSCSGKDSVKSDKIKIAVSVFPISDIVKNIAGDKADVFFVVPAGANPHTFEPSPSDVKKISSAEYFIGVDEHFDGWMEKFLSGKSSKYYLIKEEAFNKYSFNKNILNRDDHHADKNKEKHDDENGINPHIWLTFRGGKIIAESAFNFLSRKDKSNAEYYKKNFKDYTDKLDAADKIASEKFKKLQFKKIMQWHPSWNYFAEDFSLEITGVIEPGHGTEASVKKMKDLSSGAKKNNVKIIIIDLDLKSRAAETLVSEIGGRLVKLDSMGSPLKSGRSNFIDLMLYNTEILYSELNKK